MPNSHLKEGKSLRGNIVGCKSTPRCRDELNQHTMIKHKQLIRVISDDSKPYDDDVTAYHIQLIQSSM
jgi:hypothetical protein